MKLTGNKFDELSHVRFKASIIHIVWFQVSAFPRVLTDVWGQHSESHTGLPGLFLINT